MEIKYNKDKSVTINATSIEYAVITAAIAQMHIQTLNRHENNFYKPMMDAMNNAYKEHVLGGGK